VRPAILRAMSQPMIAHRGPAFRAMFDRIQRGLREVFATERPVLIATSSATGLMEAAIRNAPPGRVLALVNGAFSERFAHITEACGRIVDRYEIPWGRAHDAADVEARLQRGGQSTVTVVHSETSTGALNDVRAISDAAHRAGAVCCIDSVSGVRGVELRFDAWELDFVLTGSQKAMALPPGLAFGVATDAFLAGGVRDNRGVYFDLSELAAAAARNEAPNTPAIPLYYALAAQLDAVIAEGLAASWARHAAMSACAMRWADQFRHTTGIEVSIVADEGHRSPTVTALRLPAGLDPGALVRAVADRGYTIGAGYGKLKASTIRIGHMGDHTVSGVASCLEALGDAMRTMQGRVGEGGRQIVRVQS
jgi:aspartate aminotransferase-like enzyme